MAGRDRGTKFRAQRIDREYFRRAMPLQRWRLVLGVAAAALGLLWLGAHLATRNNTVYSAGPLTHAHAMLSQKCTVCHAGGGFSARVTDQACSGCHDGAVHQVNQTFTPHCADCHREHTGANLNAVGDRECAACHGDLHTKSAGLDGSPHIHNFTNDHPEFGLLFLKTKDPGTVKFNHAVHLRKDLRAPGGNVNLTCADCHRTDNHEPWPYGADKGQAAPQGNRKYMGPVNYYEHCSTCHPLTFDPRFNEPAPHKDPEVVHDFLVRNFTAWLSDHPEELRSPSRAEMRLPGAAPVPSAQNREAWITARVSKAEQLLRIKTCKECHDVAPADQGIPPIAKAKLTARWFTHGEFDHSAHQMLMCESCHQRATTSTKTSDVLLPGVDVCRECHVSGKQNAAGANCVECHIYHDPAKRKHVDGKFTAEQILSRR